MAEISPKSLRKLVEEYAREQVTELEGYNTEKFNEDADALKKMFGQYSEGIQFQQGDIVVWRSQLKNKKRPLEGQPAIVCEVRANEPLFDEEKSSGSPYFREELSARIGFIDEENDFVMLWVDGRRFEKKK